MGVSGGGTAPRPLGAIAHPSRRSWALGSLPTVPRGLAPAQGRTRAGAVPRVDVRHREPRPVARAPRGLAGCHRLHAGLGTAAGACPAARPGTRRALQGRRSHATTGPSVGWPRGGREAARGSAKGTGTWVQDGGLGTCVRGGAGQPAAGEAALAVPRAVPVIGTAVGAGSSTPLGALPRAEAGFGWRGGEARGSACSRPGPTAPAAPPWGDGGLRTRGAVPWHAQPGMGTPRPPYLAPRARSGRSSRGCSISPRGRMRCRCGSLAGSSPRWRCRRGGSSPGSLPREMLRAAVCPGSGARARGTRHGHRPPPASHPSPGPRAGILGGAGSTCGGEEAGPVLPALAALLGTGAAVVGEAVQPGGARGSAPHCWALTHFAGGRQGGGGPASPQGLARCRGDRGGSTLVPGVVLVGWGGWQLHKQRQQHQEEGALTQHHAAVGAPCCWAHQPGFKPCRGGGRPSRAAPSHSSTARRPWERRAQTIGRGGDSWGSTGLAARGWRALHSAPFPGHQ